MKLRSGLLLSQPMCYDCKNFYGNANWNWRCSSCADCAQTRAIKAQQSQFHTKEFQNRLMVWLKPQLADRSLLRALKWTTRHVYEQGGSCELLRGVLAKLHNSKKYISAEFASKLLRNCGRDTTTKSHYILPFVLDWWNMRNYDFKPYELCYYGRYGDDPAEYIKTIPPPAPNAPFTCKKTL